MKVDKKRKQKCPLTTSWEQWYKAGHLSRTKALGAVALGSGIYMPISIVIAAKAKCWVRFYSINIEEWYFRLGISLKRRLTWFMYFHFTLWVHIL